MKNSILSKMVKINIQVLKLTLTESLCAMHSMRIWNRCLVCLRLKLKVFWIMQLISSFTWGRRVLGERSGRDWTHRREGNKAATSIQEKQPSAPPERFLRTVLPRKKWAGGKQREAAARASEFGREPGLICQDPGKTTLGARPSGW